MGAEKPDKSFDRQTRGRKFSPASFVLSFLTMAALWIVLSGKFDLFHLGLGCVSAAIAAFLSCDLLYPEGRLFGLAGCWLRFAGYVPWLILQIFLANLHVLYLVFHPRMRELIDPHIIEFRTRLTSDFSKTTFANSITLTPGTITVKAGVLGGFAVHCIDARSGESLPGKMEERIAGVFGE
jgi:multicomponent Na+:H+ antiporter subunit E